LLLKELLKDVVVTRVAQGIGDMIAQRLLLKELLRSGGDKGCYSRNCSEVVVTKVTQRIGDKGCSRDW
jgi:hypothetical protein